MAVAKLNATLLAAKGQAYASGTDTRHLKPVFTADRFRQLNKTMTSGGGAKSHRIRKSLILDETAHKRLRMLSAKLSMSQQQLMEIAVETLLKQAQEDQNCICRMD